MANIREAEEKDISILLEWMDKLLGHIKTTSKDVYLEKIEESFHSSQQESLKNALVSDSVKIFIASNPEPVGFISGQITHPYFQPSMIKSIGNIELGWVEPNFRNRGITKKLVTKLESWFIAKGVQYAEVQYNLQNEEAEGTWPSLGYVPYRTCSRKSLKVT